MKTKVLVIALLALVALSSSAWAYRLISVPSGDLLAPGYTRIEYASCNVTGMNESLDGWYAAWKADMTVLPKLELGISSSVHHGKYATIGNAQVQLMKDPATRITASVGCWDFGSLTSGNSRGRSLFVAAMKPVAVKGLVGPMGVHIGFGDQKLNGVFGGVVVPLDKTTQFVVEYNPTNNRLPGGKWYDMAVGHNFTPNWRAKVATVGGYLGVGVVYINHLPK